MRSNRSFCLRALRLCLVGVVFACLGLSAPVGAGPLPAPKLTPGQYVYSIPSDFDPPMIGRAGMAEIQKVAKSLHYPYYVVLVDKLPTDLVNSRGGDEAAAEAVDGLAADWQMSPGYDVGKSSIFILAYDPRKYRFLAGATWKTRLGFERGAHAQYTAIFEQYVQGTPKDPKTGIIEMMKAVDAYLFDNTDPARIRARKQAAERAAALQRLQEAQGSLDREIARAERLLASPRPYLPSDTRKYESALSAGRDARLNGGAGVAEKAAASLSARNDDLEKYVTERRGAAERRERDAAARTGGMVVFFVVVAFAGVSRLVVFRRMKKQFADATALWDTKLTNAKERYIQFYGEERGRVTGLSGLSGETKEMYDRVTDSIDSIYLGVQAMEAHVAECRATASGASALRIGPLRRATQDLECPFKYDTQQADPRNLFGPSTKILSLTPAEFSRELEAQFSKTLDDWDRLKRVSQDRMKPAEELFTQEKLDAMLALADQYEIPHSWASDHPLFGGADEDQTLYDKVNATRLSDPVAFMRQIEALKETEQQTEERMNRLAEAVKLARSERLEEPPSVGETVIGRGDDPRSTFEEARAAEAAFVGMVAARAGKEGVEQVEAQAVAVRDLYLKCSGQAVAIDEAIKGATEGIANADSGLREAGGAVERAKERLKEARQIHSNAVVALRLMEASHGTAADAASLLDSARRNLSENRHLDAARGAWRALSCAKRAEDLADQVMAACDTLDRQKAEFEERVRGLEGARERAERRLRRYGRSGSNLADIKDWRLSGPMDYLALLASVEHLEQAWDVEVRKAEREYDRRQERMRRDNDNSSFGGWGGGGFGGGSSSSGGGFGGGGSSSSGGSSGGGGSSSSGGSW